MWRRSTTPRIDWDANAEKQLHRSQVGLYETSAESHLQHRVRMRSHSKLQALTLRNSRFIHRLHLDAPKVILSLEVRPIDFVTSTLPVNCLS